MLLVGPLRSTLQSSSCGGGRCRSVRRHLLLGFFWANYNVNWVIFVVTDFWIQSSRRFSTWELLHSCLLAFLMLTYIDLEQLLALLIITIIYLDMKCCYKYSSVGFKVSTTYCSSGSGANQNVGCVSWVFANVFVGAGMSFVSICVYFMPGLCSQIPKIRTSANFAICPSGSNWDINPT